MDKYQNIRKIGKGNFGDVVLVERICDKEQFALKQVDSPLEYSSNNTSSEAKLLESLDHPNIIKCYESFYDNHNLCIILEYADNGDLLKQIQEAKESGIYIPESKILEWFSQLCLAIKYLNDKKILHRDIKVQNTFLTHTGLIKLGDFGISKQLNNTYEFAKTQVGTPFYLSPEMCLMSTHTHKSDMWMLGCLLHELCSLNKPFPGDNLHILVHKITKEKPTEIPEHYSPFIKMLINKLLQKTPENRPNVNQILRLDQIAKEVMNLRINYKDTYKNMDWAFLDNVPLSSLTSEITLSSHSISKSMFEGKSNSPNEDTLYFQCKNLDTQDYKLNKDAQKQQNSISPKEYAKPPLHSYRDSAMATKRPKKSQNSISSLLEQKKIRSSLSPSSIERIKSKSSSINSLNGLIQDNNITFASFNTEPCEACAYTERSNSSLEGPISMKNGDYTYQRSYTKYKSLSIPYQLTKNDANFNQNDHDDISISEEINSDYDSFLAKPNPEPKPLYHRDLEINTEGLDHHGQANLTAKEEKDKQNNSLQSMKTPNSINSSQASDSNNKLNTPDSSLPTVKPSKKKKIFTFSEKLFDFHSPTPENRSFWFKQFLIKKLGEERFEKAMVFLENNPNISQIIDEPKSELLDILGEENRECFKMLVCVLTSSITPTSEKKNSHYIEKCKKASLFTNYQRNQMISSRTWDMKTTCPESQNEDSVDYLKHQSNKSNISIKITPEKSFTTKENRAPFISTNPSHASIDSELNLMPKHQQDQINSIHSFAYKTSSNPTFGTNSTNIMKNHQIWLHY